MSWNQGLLVRSWGQVMIGRRLCPSTERSINKHLYGDHPDPNNEHRPIQLALIDFLSFPSVLIAVRSDNLLGPDCFGDIATAIPHPLLSNNMDTYGGGMIYKLIPFKTPCLPFPKRWWWLNSGEICLGWPPPEPHQAARHCSILRPFLSTDSGGGEAVTTPRLYPSAALTNDPAIISWSGQ